MKGFTHVSREQHNHEEGRKERGRENKLGSECEEGLLGGISTLKEETR